MTATPVSKPDMPNASLGNRMRAIAIIIQRVAVLGHQRLLPVADHAGLLGDVHE